MSTITWMSYLQPCYAVPVHALPIPPARPSIRTCPRRLLTSLVGAEGPLGPHASGTPPHTLSLRAKRHHPSNTLALL
eukprot:9154766-Pyramimonas_sp.AAC.1